LETRRPLVEPLDPRMVDAVFSSQRGNEGCFKDTRPTTPGP
jgi:hypothetical protein